jgi:putative transposase
VSLPREILSGTTYLITRRCLARTFLLRPSRRVNAIIAFCLAVAAKRTGVLVHACCVLSNHYHLVVTDPDARLPEMMRYFNEFVAKGINQLLRRWEVVFKPGSYSAVRLETREAVLDKLAYVLANPVSAGLVAHSHLWPGLRLGPSSLGRELAFERPKGFFRTEGPVAENASLQISKPPALCELTDAQYKAEVEETIRARESESRQAATEAGRRFLGRRAVLEQDPEGSPNTPASHREINPRIACRDRWKRIEALQRLRQFVDDYRRAYHLFRQGLRMVLFPRGTYRMRVFYGVACASSS